MRRAPPIFPPIAGLIADFIAGFIAGFIAIWRFVTNIIAPEPVLRPRQQPPRAITQIAIDLSGRRNGAAHSVRRAAPVLTGIMIA